MEGLQQEKKKERMKLNYRYEMKNNAFETEMAAFQCWNICLLKNIST